MSGIIDAKTPGQALAIVIAMTRHGIGNREARLLLAHAAGIERHQLADLGVGDFTDDLIGRYLALADRRMRREPMSQILGVSRLLPGRGFEVTS